MRKFSPDTRNFGGRKVISDQYRVHHELLSNVKATLSTRPVQALPPAGQKKLNMQKSFDSGFHITRANKSLLSEHLLNIKHMKRRIQSIGSYNERKKNPFDPITHPVVFFRNGNEGDDPTLNRKFIARSVKPMKISEVYLKEGKKVDTASDIQIEVPVVEAVERDQVAWMKEKLLDAIVKNRIYKDVDIQELFKVTREANPHLEKAVMDRVCNLIYKEIDC